MFTSSWGPHAQNAQTNAFDAETERADVHVVEVSLVWGDTTLAIRHVEEGKTLTIGSSNADLLLPSTADLPIDVNVDVDVDVNVDVVANVVDQTPLRIFHGAQGVQVDVPSSSAARVTIDGHPRDASSFDLNAGHHAEIYVGPFAVFMRVVPAGRAVPATWSDRVRDVRMGGVAMSFLLHASIVASLAFFMPSLTADDSDAIDRDRLYAMKAMLDAAAARENERTETADEASAANEGAESGGGRAKNAEGAMGTREAKTQGHYAARGDARPNEVTLSKKEMLEMARNSAMSSLVGALATSMANEGPTVPWDSVLNGMDKQSFAGNLWANELGDAFGSGLGFSGLEDGGGGDNIGVGMKDVGGLGRSLAMREGGTCLTPPCDGTGHSTGVLGRPHVAKAPRMRVGDTKTEGGHLPAEVIQRIVRLSHGRFRNCYESGLRANPSLGGRVSVRFVIGRDGGVSLASDAGSDLPDEGVRQCVVKTFYTLSFPQPENGTVRVTYPLVFSPAD